MNPIIDLADLLETHISGMTSFPYKVPQDILKTTKLPIAKIEPVTNSNGTYGSNRYHTRTYRIQVQVFIDAQKTDMESLIDKMDRLLEARGFYQIFGEEQPDEKENVYVITRQYKTTRRK